MFNVVLRLNDYCGYTSVYSVKNDKNGYPQFLIYYKNQWVWKSAKYFEPMEGIK